MLNLRFNEDINDLIMQYGYDIISSPGMELEKNFKHHGNTSCFEHSLFVAYMSVWLVKKFNIQVDMSSLIRGALLHDYFLYDWHVPDKSHRLHGFVHAKIALKNAKRDFTINEREEDIILTHMFPLNLKVPKYKESFIVTFVDKICAVCEVFNINLSKLYNQLEMK